MKKLISLFLSVLLLVGCMATFASCGEETLVMATNATFPPYEYMEGDKFVGIDVEIAQAIADRLGLKLKIENTEFDTIIGGVQTGKYDMGMAGMTVTPKRQESVNFSTTYATGIQVVIIPENSPYTTVDDFFNEDGTVKADLKIGVQQGTTGDIYASDTVENGGFGEDHVTKYKNGPDAVAALKQGKIHAVIIDNEPAKNYVKNNTGLKIMETEYANEEYAICVAKENTDLLNRINQALADLKADGTIDRIIAKYIPAED